MDSDTNISQEKAPAQKRKRAKRLDPSVRQELIVDAASRLVEQRQSASFTLDEVAAEAGVSRPLVHRYFSCRDSLLQALLLREFDLIIGTQKGLVPDDVSTAEAHRIYIRRHFEYLKDRGRIYYMLLNEAHAEGGEASKLARKFFNRSRTYWIDRKKNDGLREEEAILGMLMTMSALQGAESTLRKERLTVEEASDFWTTFVLAGWEAVAAKSAKSKTED